MSIQEKSGTLYQVEFLQIAKLVGSNSVGQSNQGSSIALSSDGSTAVVGGPNDSFGTGALWIYSRADDGWSQQGEKVVANNADGPSALGTSVAISADGNTVIAGGAGDSQAGLSAGAAWIFTRTNGVWTQQAKLLASGSVGPAQQGKAVAISADGNTCAVGGSGDEDGIGAVWVYNRSNGVWSQNGKKLQGSGFPSNANQGSSLAMSGDGKTIIVGSVVMEQVNAPVWVFTDSNGYHQQGSYLTANGSINDPVAQNTSLAMSADGSTFVLGENQDNNQTGAAWVFINGPDGWQQQGDKIVGTGSIGKAAQGCAVAISSNGNFITVGGNTQNNKAGALWAFQRAGNHWSQIGNKLIGTEGDSAALQGNSVAMSASGNTLIWGGPNEDSGVGAIWISYKLNTPN